MGKFRQAIDDILGIDRAAADNDEWFRRRVRGVLAAFGGRSRKVVQLHPDPERSTPADVVEAVRLAEERVRDIADRTSYSAVRAEAAGLRAELKAARGDLAVTRRLLSDTDAFAKETEASLVAQRDEARVRIAELEQGLADTVASARGSFEVRLRDDITRMKSQRDQLWMVLDDIDTFDDMAKGDEKLYRQQVRNLVAKRHEVVEAAKVDGSTSVFQAALGGMQNNLSDTPRPGRD